MKELMLGNKAFARGLYEEAAVLFPLIPEHPVPK